MKIVKIAALSAVSFIANAAPFLVSDPYVAEVAQPDQFVVTLDAAAPITVQAAKNAQGLPYLNYDLTGITGRHTVKVRAKNAWGESADTAPFVFNAEKPATPGNVSVTVK